MRWKAVAVLGLLTLAVALPAPAVSGGVRRATGVSPAVLQASVEETNVVPLSVAYRFDTEGLLSLVDPEGLPVREQAPR